MGGWMADNPELADELFIKNCPAELRLKLENDEVSISDIPWTVAGPIWEKVDLAYADRCADHADSLRKAQREGV